MSWIVGNVEYRRIGFPIEPGEKKSRIWAAFDRAGEEENPALSPRENPGVWFVKSMAMAWFKSRTRRQRHNYVSTSEAEKLIEAASKEE